MSIEVALADAVNAMRQLTAEIAVLNGRTKAGALSPAEKDATAARQSQDADNAAREALQKARDTAKTASPPAQPAGLTAEEKKAVTTALSYETHIKGWLLALVKKNRQTALGLYEKYGVKIGAELKPEQLPAFKVDLDAALAANGVTEPAKIEAKK
jgi:hypothetical protein